MCALSNWLKIYPSILFLLITNKPSITQLNIFLIKKEINRVRLNLPQFIKHSNTGL